MKRRGVKESDPYDWEKAASDALAGGGGTAVVGVAGGGVISSNLGGVSVNQSHVAGGKNDVAMLHTIGGGAQITQMTVAGSNGGGSAIVDGYIVVQQQQRRRQQQMGATNNADSITGGLERGVDSTAQMATTEPLNIAQHRDKVSARLAARAILYYIISVCLWCFVSAQKDGATNHRLLMLDSQRNNAIGATGGGAASEGFDKNCNSTGGNGGLVQQLHLSNQQQQQGATSNNMLITQLQQQQQHSGGKVRRPRTHFYCIPLRFPHPLRAPLQFKTQTTTQYSHTAHLRIPHVCFSFNHPHNRYKYYSLNLLSRSLHILSLLSQYTSILPFITHFDSVCLIRLSPASKPFVFFFRLSHFAAGAVAANDGQPPPPPPASSSSSATFLAAGALRTSSVLNHNHVGWGWWWWWCH